ncbi:MAG TPA: HesA/MoeB/ThiF family protein [Candidatus Bathyarchaeia archaeon]|nr:HesA/MoeB/ThiF family protein [Candidatus Bathyarchaeia archaeon]
MNVQMSDYFARQSAIAEIGVSGLQRLQSAKLAVVGTGGVGSAAAYFLASLGIGHLKLIDQDIVEESNLHRLIGADPQDLHLPKAEVLGRKLNSGHPWTRTEGIVETLRKENAEELLADIDLIIDGTDNFRARYILNRFAAENNIPYLFTSGIANQGHLSLFNPPATPCLECLMPMTRPGSVDTCETLGVTPTVVGMVGTLAATEAVKKVLGLPTRILGHLLTVDLAGPDFLFTTITKREKCGVCNGSPSDEAHHDNAVMLCGDNVANVLPERDFVVDLQSLNAKVPKESVVASSESVFVYNRQLHRVSVFKTGRLLIGNVHTEDAARQVANEAWNEILA